MKGFKWGVERPKPKPKTCQGCGEKFVFSGKHQTHGPCKDAGWVVGVALKPKGISMSKLKGRLAAAAKGVTPVDLNVGSDVKAALAGLDATITKHSGRKAKKAKKGTARFAFTQLRPTSTAGTTESATCWKVEKIEQFRPAHGLHFCPSCSTPIRDYKNAVANVPWDYCARCGQNLMSVRTAVATGNAKTGVKYDPA